MKLVVGLGNPGRKYEKTRHNVGWMTLDRFDLHFSEEKKFQAAIAKRGDVLFCKPLTFMNNSGQAVRAIIDYYTISIKDIIVVYDDKDLHLGIVRLRSEGSAAGHNGIRSILQHLGTDTFSRVRIGIASERAKGDTAKFVLGRFARAERATVHQVTELAHDGIEMILTDGLNKKQHRDLTI